MIRQSKIKSVIAAGAVAVLALSMAACGGNAAGEKAAGPKTTVGSGELADALPAAFKDKGKLIWAVEPYFPPFQMTGDDDKTLIGVNIELLNKISGLLGVEAEIVESKFDALIPGIQANRYDLVIDAMADTEERRQLVNFVDYFKSGSAIFVAPGNPKKVTAMDDLCSLSVGAVKASFQVEDAEAQQAKCKTDGKAKLTTQVYPDQAGMLLALSSGRTDAMLMDFAAGSFAASSSNNNFELTGSITGAKRKGIVVSKENTELAEAVKKAVQHLMDNGEYTKIMDKWKLSSGALDTATINDGNAY